MDLKMQIKTLETLYRIVNGRMPESKTSQGKPPFKPRDNSGVFEELLPEQTGVRSEGLLKMFSALSESGEICPHSILVLKGGKLIAKADWSPFTSAYPHVSHSLCKSIVSMAVGIAAKEKYISVNEKISDIFPDEMPALPNELMKKITVRHLLTMSSGVRFNEVSAVISKSWIKGFLSSDVLFEPGTDFMYNSLNTYMLSAAICRRTGISLSEYLDRRLFGPMGIDDFYWEKCPDDIEKGGWGLYMNIYDYAKLGLLYLKGGVWNGVRLVPAEWVTDSVSRQIAKPNSPCYDGYGYQIWLTHRNNGFVFNGMFGQNVFVFPKRDMVIAMTAGSSNLFPKCRAMKIIEEFIENGANFSNSPIKDFRYANAAALRTSLADARFGEPLEIKGRQSFFSRLRQSLSRIRTDTLIPEAAEMLDGITITLEKNNTGLLPVLIRIMDGISEQGISQVSFAVKSGRFILRIEESGTSVYIPVSFTKEPAYFDLELGGSSFHVGSVGSFISDEDGFPVLKIMLCFVETSYTKILKFIFGADGIILKLRESPQLYGALDEAAGMIMPSLKDSTKKTVETILETDIAEYKLKSFLEPTIKGTLKMN